MLNCKNCNTPINEDDQFCHKCGQNTKNYNINFRILLEDFLEEAFGYDSRIKHTILPFLTNPSYLSKEFLSGKRVTYVLPLRLYLFCSLLFIFTFNNLLIDKHGFKIDFKELLAKTGDTVKEQFKTEPNDSYKDYYDIDSTEYAKEYINVNVDNDSLSDQLTKELNLIFDAIRERETLEESFIQDTLQVHDWYKVKLIKQAKYIYEDNAVLFLQTVLSNISIAIMLLVPIFALYLKVLYVRKKKVQNRYIQHFIFSIHLHAFALFIFTLCIILGQIHFASINVLITPLLIYWMIISTLMFRKFYKQSWKKTLLKVFVAINIHCFVIALVASLEIFISLYIF
ncbi:DUF3667 domain-containing protein [Flammeovirga sp. SubArs3]|uniref:DUF3667 domain-containing protein n=1 Tax=Flammeovirga sp. SubArs3 TaxID=2995316 RepID=UPI00248D2855|nr:DUF3667 domain-containing protein [Flammeovirga sp. SubArs3]